MARGSGTPKVTVGVRLPPDTIVWLDAYAARKGLTRSAAAARVMELTRANNPAQKDSQ